MIWTQILGGGLLVGLLVLNWRLRRAIKPRPMPMPLSAYPSVTVIRPVKGLDFGAEKNLQAALHNEYPGKLEILFVLDDEKEPAYPLVRDAILSRQSDQKDIQARIIFSGEPPTGLTGKLNAMIAGLQESRGELIAFADSDLRPDKDCLRVLVETLLSNPEAGAAFAPVVATEETVTFGDVGYAILINGMYGPVAAEVARKKNGELPFIMGEFSVLTRKAIESIGGLESASGQLVDDMYLGARTKAAGYRNLVSPKRVPVIQQHTKLLEFWGIFVRWIAFSRSGLPGREFKMLAYSQPVIFWLGLGGAIISLTQQWWLSAILLGLAPIGTTLSINDLHWRFGGKRLSFGQWFDSFAILLMGPLVLVSILTKREVSWRGRKYKLDGHSRLAESPTAADDNLHPEPADTNPLTLPLPNLEAWGAADEGGAQMPYHEKSGDDHHERYMGRV